MAIDPRNYGLNKSDRFVMSRSVGGVTAESDPIEWPDLADYLDACGLSDNDEGRIAAILAGLPFEIDDSIITVRPLRIKKSIAQTIHNQTLYIIGVIIAAIGATAAIVHLVK